MATLQEMIGKTFDFYGIDNCCFKLNGMVYEAIEDEQDGYRSSLKELAVRSTNGLNFFATPIAKVRVEERGNHSGNTFDGHALVDDSGHEWLFVGTSNYDDYYPCFIFDYRPKAAL